MFRALFAFLVLLFGGITAGHAVTPIEAELLADVATISPGKPFTAAVHLRIASGWHTYWQNPGDSGLPVMISWKLPPGWKAGSLQWPLPAKHIEEGGMITYGYEGEVLILAELIPASELTPGKPITLQADTTWLACAKTCVPGSASLTLALSPTPPGNTAQPANHDLFEKFRTLLPKLDSPPFSLRWEPGDTEILLKLKGIPTDAQVTYFPIDPPATHPEQPSPNLIRLPFSEEKPTTVKGLLVVENGNQREGWMVHSPSATSLPASTAPTQSGSASLTVPYALSLGFIGGLLLNLMPCVLPVIALKIFGFLGQAGQSRQRVFRSGLAFTGGIFAWFLGLAAVVIIARGFGGQVSWAFQFHNPALVFGMMLLVFVFALNLLGVFELWLPGVGKLASISDRQGYTGAFLHGVFATLLATPCTAPFLGSALAFAFTQNAPVTLAMFASIAAGMSSPYVILTAKPGWMRWLPKPGMWMIRLKQVMGFLMLGSTVWLLGVFSSQRGAQEAVGAAWVLLGVGGACWIFGTWFTPASRQFQKLLAVLAMAALVSSGFALGKRQNAPSDFHWEAWSSERVAALQKQGKPVFIDFTAEWCLNCKYNEHLVLDTPEVRSALNSFAILKADWTKGDPKITAELKRLGRAGVPVYVVLPANGGEPEVLPELLTQRTVLEALERAK